MLNFYKGPNNAPLMEIMSISFKNLNKSVYEFCIMRMLYTKPTVMENIKKNTINLKAEGNLYDS